MTNKFNPDWDTQAVLAEEIQRMAKRIEELEEKDEPVAGMCADESLINKGYARFSHVCMGEWKIPVYTTPPQRKPLTSEEIWEALGGVDCTRPTLIARAIEAAHGITGDNNG